MLPNLRFPKPRLSKTEVRDAALDEDLAYQTPVRIPDLHPIPTSGMHVSVHFALDAVGPAAICKRKETSVRQERTRSDVESVDVAGACSVDGDVFVAVNGASVCDVDDAQVGREAETVGSNEAIGNSADVLGLGLESIELDKAG